MLVILVLVGTATLALIAFASTTLVLAASTPLVGVKLPTAAAFLATSALAGILVVAATTILLVLALIFWVLWFVVLIGCRCTLRPRIRTFLRERNLLAFGLVLVLLLGFFCLVFRWHLLFLFYYSLTWEKKAYRGEYTYTFLK